MAPVNNHRPDGKSMQDKNLRAYQQSMLHLQRLLAFGYLAITTKQEEQTIRAIQEQTFQFVAEITQRMKNQRK